MSGKAKDTATVSVFVTRLEMTAPTKLWFPVPVNIQAALMRVHTIPLAYYRYLYRQVGNRWKWVERLRLTDEELSETLHRDTVNITVLYINGAPAGFFELHQQPNDVVEIVYFGLMQQALGLGIGKWFLLQTLQTAWTYNPVKVIVETNSADHPRALQLYQRFGFTPYETSGAEIRLLSHKEELDLATRDLLF